jgi:hypothetical protein
MGGPITERHFYMIIVNLSPGICSDDHHRAVYTDLKTGCPSPLHGRPPVLCDLVVGFADSPEWCGYQDLIRRLEPLMSRLTGRLQ